MLHTDIPSSKVTGCLSRCVYTQFPEQLFHVQCLASLKKPSEGLCFMMMLVTAACPHSFLSLLFRDWGWTQRVKGIKQSCRPHFFTDSCRCLKHHCYSHIHCIKTISEEIKTKSNIKINMYSMKHYCVMPITVSAPHFKFPELSISHVSHL